MRRSPICNFGYRPGPVFYRIVRHAGQVVLKLVIEADALALFRGIRRECWALRGGP